MFYDVRTALRTGLVLVGLLASTASHAVVPGQIDFQGLLLDSGGQPVTGMVDLDFGLFAVPSAGTALWTESHTDVDVLDGVYHVALGSSVTITPDLLVGGTVFLEITVDGDTLSPRRELLAVPYALRSATADSVGTLASGFLTELFEETNWDGGGPPNDHPSEGLADSDSDGQANFIDPDNDNDGIDDITEVAQGSDINVITPDITAFVPPNADGFFAATVQVQGQNFVSGMTVVFGSQNPVPTNLTSTSFDVLVGPQAPGSATVSVTRPNGESGSESFDWLLVTPSITSLTPPDANAAETTLVHVAGQDFQPGLAVQFGTESPTPQNFSATGFDVSVGPQPAGTVSVQVDNPNGESDSTTFDFVPIKRVFLTSSIPLGDLGGLSGADGICNTLASNAGLTGTFQAWLADSTDSPDTRLSKTVGPYLRVDDTRIADDWADLTDGTLQASINVREDGLVVTATPTEAWTNVATDGTAAGGNNCLDWTSALSGETGLAGFSGSTNFLWTGGSDRSCLLFSHLYCFEE